MTFDHFLFLQPSPTDSLVQHRIQLYLLMPMLTYTVFMHFTCCYAYDFDIFYILLLRMYRVITRTNSYRCKYVHLLL